MLAELFLAGRRPESGLAVDALERALGELWRACREAWPTLSLPVEDFLPYLAARLPRGEPLAAGLARVQAPELYLCAACVRREPAALALLEERYLSTLDVGGRLASGQRDEVRQLVRIKLLAGDGARPPKLAEYTGRGALRSWLAVTATRTALNLRRSTAGEEALDEDLAGALAAPGDTPELSYLKQTCRTELRNALTEAFARLERRQRNLLRQQVLDGLTAVELAALYRVHRVTVGRWLDEARAALVQHVRAILEQRLGGAGQDASALLGVLASRIDVSLPTALRSLAPGG